jgi:hypothetical protein
MAISTPCVCTREDVQRAVDFKDSALANTQVDRAIASATRNIEGRLKRRFFPQDRVRYFDWPNYQYADPWRLWLNQYDLIVCTLLESPVGTSIPLNQVFLEPVNKESWEPFRSVVLDRSSNAAWGTAPTPQHAIAVTGTWSYTAEMDSAGTLAAAVTTTTAGTITVSDGSLAGIGDLLILDPGRSAAPFPSAAGYAGALQGYTGERVLVTDRATVTTGQTNVSGAATASNADVAVTVTDGTQVHVGEVLLLDTEQLLVTGITGNVLTVKRAWNGTVLAAHSLATTLYAYRLLSVLRGHAGTTAATHLINAAVSRHRPPPLARDLGIAVAINQIESEGSGWARTVGAGDNVRNATGAGLAQMWRDAIEAHGRQVRTRVI